MYVHTATVVWSSTEGSSDYAWGVNTNSSYITNGLKSYPGYYVFGFVALSGKPGNPKYNGHEYVDLGLPSGTKWATMNVGATSETDYGNYYMYGMGSKTYDSTDTPYDGTEDPLDLSKDTARQVWGGDWHMPTRAQMQELTANTTYQWVTNYKGSGINGGTFTATNGAVLFLPAAGGWFNGSQWDVGSEGLYWCSSPRSSDSAYTLDFSSGNKNVNDGSRGGGYPVRPVIG
jgi:hypothetical protein